MLEQGKEVRSTDYDHKQDSRAGLSETRPFENDLLDRGEGVSHSYAGEEGLGGKAHHPPS